MERARTGLSSEPRDDIQRSHLARIEYAAWSIADITRWREVARDAAVYNNRAVFPRWIAGSGGMAAFNARWAGFLPALQRLRQPVAFIVGDADMNTEPALWPALVAGIPAATLVVVPQAGHMPWIDQPARVGDALRSALGH